MSLSNFNPEKAILEAASELIATIDLEQRLLYLNPSARHLLSLPQDYDLEQQDLRVKDLHAPDVYRELNEDIFPTLLAGQGRWEGELEFLDFHGQSRPMQMTIILHTDADGEPLWITGIGRDLRRRKHLEAQQRLAKRVFDNAIEGIIVTDGRACIQHVNPAFTEITGYSAEEALGQTPKMLRSNHHDQAFYDTMWQSIADTDRWQGEVWNRRKNGSVYLQWLSINCVRDAQGYIENYISIFHDLTEMRAKEAEIQHLAHHDPLTGLGNRHLLNERLQHAVRQAKVQEEKLALLVLDLGHIQLINDSLGHTWCDRLIRGQSARIKEVVAEADTLVRIGSDEFALLIEDYEAVHDVSQIADDLIRVLQEEVQLGRHQVTLSPSVGVAFFPQDAQNSVELLINAQTALLDAKKSGRDTFRFFNREMSQQARERLKLEQALRSAVKGEGLSLHYQPKVLLEDGRLYGAEALLRWTHPELGPLSPAVFIPLAEEAGLIVDIGDWVLRHTCQQLVAWQEAGYTLPRIAVNLSVHQLEETEFAQKLEELLEAYQLDREVLELEITETGLMKNQNQALQSLRQLKEKGFRIALDDFGTGYSSLSYLSKLPLSTLKIDRSFVIDMARDTISLNIVKTIIQLAHNLSLDLVAEGVEDAQQADQLLRLGCTLAQGFHYYRPLPESEFTQLLAASSR
ncbi:putative bifunctional diguanylate cyclase/phosphodiesterase [Marinospirillum perlucidum]|uniref:putative bifunctional diguanylate cyclase/phosphodiesterase n=1 Tax=Marinospirillum perlucidum TaxID=1982602 RepID=UPI00138FCC54|nr:EAL domain-containing protein [Marinospirillum perlucidum]